MTGAATGRGAHGGRRVSALGACRRASPLRSRRLAGAVASGGVGAVGSVGLLATSAWLITRASLRPPVLALSVAIGAVQAFALARGISRYVERLSVHGLSLEVLASLRLGLFDRLAALVPGGLPSRRSGEVLTAFVSDADAVAETLARTVTSEVDAAAAAVSGIALAIVVDPLAGGALAAGTLAGAAAAALLARPARGVARREASARAEVADVVVDAARAAPELVAHGRADLVHAAIAAAERRAASAAAMAALLSGARRALALVLGAATVVGVACAGLAAYDARRIGGVSVAVLVFVALATVEAASPLSDALATVAVGDEAAARIVALERLVPPAPEPASPSIPPARPCGLALEDAVVERDGTRVLDGASLSVLPGARVALVGPSGSGKTTAVLALVHFLECSGGRATLGGVPVDELARPDLRDRVGWVPEDTHVFAATLASNLRIANLEATDEQCERALEDVGLGAWLASLDAGLATVLGTGGRPLSAGERQRLGLARAVLDDPDVLVLDEPTAHLDRAGGSLVFERLAGEPSRRGVLVVSHDPDTLRHADVVVAIEAGATRTGTAPQR